MLRSLLSESLSRTLWPFLISDRMGKGKMAPLDSNPEDHGHLLGDGIGRMPRGCGKNRGCQKFQSRSCAGAFRAFIITHSRLRASGKTGNALLHVGKPCARTFAPSIFPEHALSSAASLVRAFNVLVPLGMGVSSDDSVSRLLSSFSSGFVVSAVQAMESVDRALTLLTTAAAIANTFAQGCNSPRVWSWWKRTKDTTRWKTQAQARFDESRGVPDGKGLDLLCEPRGSGQRKETVGVTLCVHLSA